MVTDRMRLLSKRTIGLVVAHTVVYALYCYIQGRVNILFRMEVYVPIIVFFTLAPLLLVFFLTTETGRLWTIALFGILLSSLIYNIYLKFIPYSLEPMITPDVIWEIVYEVLFGVVLILEAIGLYLTVGVLQEIHRQTKK